MGSSLPPASESSNWSASWRRSVFRDGVKTSTRRNAASVAPPCLGVQLKCVRALCRSSEASPSLSLPATFSSKPERSGSFPRARSLRPGEPCSSSPPSSEPPPLCLRWFRARWSTHEAGSCGPSTASEAAETHTVRAPDVDADGNRSSRSTAVAMLLRFVLREAAYVMRHASETLIGSEARHLEERTRPLLLQSSLST